LNYLKVSDDGVLGFSVLFESIFVQICQVCSDLLNGFYNVIEIV
jgi:hypothetical protein